MAIFCVQSAKGELDQLLPPLITANNLNVLVEITFRGNQNVNGGEILLWGLKKPKNTREEFFRLTQMLGLEYANFKKAFSEWASIISVYEPSYRKNRVSGGELENLQTLASLGFSTNWNDKGGVFPAMNSANEIADAFRKIRIVIGHMAEMVIELKFSLKNASYIQISSLDEIQSNVDRLLVHFELLARVGRAMQEKWGGVLSGAIRNLRGYDKILALAQLAQRHDKNIGRNELAELLAKQCPDVGSSAIKKQLTKWVKSGDLNPWSGTKGGRRKKS